MKLFCLCTRALRGNRLHRPFHARGDRGYFSPFSPRPPTPPTVRPRFTQLVHPISFASSPLPQIHSRTLSGAAVLTPAVCPLFGVKPTSTANTPHRPPAFHSTSPPNLLRQLPPPPDPQQNPLRRRRAHPGRVPALRRQAYLHCRSQHAAARASPSSFARQPPSSISMQ